MHKSLNNIFIDKYFQDLKKIITSKKEKVYHEIIKILLFTYFTIKVIL